MMMQVVFDASRVSINKVLLISQYTFNETAILPKAAAINDCEEWKEGEYAQDELNI